MNDFLSGIAQRLTTIFNPATLGAAAADLVANLVIGVATFATYYLLWRILDLITKRVSTGMNADPTTREFVRTLLKFAVLALGAVSALAAVGVNTASLLASLGVAGLTIGFAARDALSNMISGLLIYWDRPFVIGDLVEVGGHYGRVDRITLRSTRVVTVDGRMLAVPNAEIINTTVASYTNFPNLRIDVAVTVGVGESIGHVREILLGLARDHDDYMERPEPKVVVTRLNDYNVELELRAWAYDERRHVDLRTDLRERIFDALNRAGVDMPPETFRIEPLTLEREAS